VAKVDLVSILRSVVKLGYLYEVNSRSGCNNYRHKKLESLLYKALKLKTIWLKWMTNFMWSTSLGRCYPVSFCDCLRVEYGSLSVTETQFDLVWIPNTQTWF